MTRTLMRIRPVGSHAATCVVALLALTLAAPLASAQTAVQPATRTLLLSAGKSATVKINAGDCKPTWSATSNDTGVASVSPATSGASTARNFKVTAPKGQFSGSTTVDITLDGAGAGCAEMEVITITVYVVMDANAPKHFASGDKNTGIVGTKKRVKEVKKSAGSLDKQFNKDLKAILKQLKSGTLPPQPEGPGDAIPDAIWALALVSDCEDEFFDALEDVFIAFVEGLADDGYSLMSLYGFLDFLDEFIAEEFQTGSCSLWDTAVHDASHAIVDIAHRGDDRIKRITDQIDSWSANSLTPAWGNPGISTLQFPISTGGVEPTTALNYDTAKNKVLKIRKTMSNNFVDENGSNEHGSIRVKGKAPSAGGTLTITYERLNSSGNPIGTDTGDYFQETGVTLDAKCKFKGSAPGVLTTGNLRPGQWRVTVTQGSGDSETNTTSSVTIPTGT